MIPTSTPALVPTLLNSTDPGAALIVILLIFGAVSIGLYVAYRERRK